MCGDCQLNPVNYPVGTLLEFLQARFSAGLTHSTLKIYVAAIAAYHAPLGGQSVDKHPLVTCFLRGALRPPVREAYDKRWIRMLSIASSPLIAPLLGGQGSLYEKCGSLEGLFGSCAYAGHLFSYHSCALPL